MLDHLLHTFLLVFKVLGTLLFLKLDLVFTGGFLPFLVELQVGFSFLGSCREFALFLFVSVLSGVDLSAQLLCSLLVCSRQLKVCDTITHFEDSLKHFNSLLVGLFVSN
jgi:hypothetical protein